jgi:hypothetical protein
VPAVVEQRGEGHSRCFKVQGGRQGNGESDDGEHSTLRYFEVTVLSNFSSSTVQSDQIGRNFDIWATFKGLGDFLGENIVCCRYFKS